MELGQCTLRAYVTIAETAESDDLAVDSDSELDEMDFMALD